jgi:hypothetical protein
MILLDETDQSPGSGSTLQISLSLPQTRPSFLDPCVRGEPWIDACPTEDTLVLFLLNRPIALMSGSLLDHVSLNTLLNQLRHRNPRKRTTASWRPTSA